VAAEPLRSLLRLRRFAMDEARRQLAMRLRSEGEATDHLAAVEAAVRRETVLAEELAGTDMAGWAYPVWLRRIQQTRRDAEATVQAAAEHTSAAQADLADARAAARGLEAALDRQEVAHQASLARQEQALLDEAGLRRR
jgi:flagellar export protein FliJ